MKLLLFLGLLNTSVFANYSRDELLLLDADPRYQVLGQVTIEGTAVSILNVCSDSEVIRTIEPVTRCTEYRWVDSKDPAVGRRSERMIRKCVGIETVDLSNPLFGEVEYCKVFKSSGYENRADAIHNLPDSCSVWGRKFKKLVQTVFYPEVSYRNGSERGTLRPATTRYDIPECE